MILNNEVNIRKICYSGIYNEKSVLFKKICYLYE